MNKKKILKNKQGGVLPLVAIILGLFALGFIALVVDLGFLYVERKAMITSADAAALAGAQVLREYKVKKLLDTEAIEKAKEIAKEYAIANGAEKSQVDILVGNKHITLPNGNKETRQVVEVTVGKNKELIFARFLGDEDTDVKAQAIATGDMFIKHI